MQPRVVAKRTLMAVLLVALAVASAWAGELRPAGVTPYGETLLAQINQYRQENGLNGLRFDPGLVRLAQKHSFEMFRDKRISHGNFNQRFERADSRLCVENVGWHYSNPLDIFAAWQGSRGHDQNMLREGINQAGIAEVGEYVTFFACK